MHRPAFGVRERPMAPPPAAARMRAPIFAVLFIAAFLWPEAAFAHTDGGGALGFISGLRHPVSGLDHVLAMIAVGLWGAQLGAPAVWLLPVTFPMTMAVGGMLGLMGVHIPGVEIAIAGSAIVLGLMVASEARPHPAIAGALVAIFAIFHGHAHGVELPKGADGLGYSIGFVVSTGTLHAAGITIGLLHRSLPGRRLLRVLGAGIILAGGFFLRNALR